MKELWNFYLTMGIITIPLTISLITYIIQEMLDLLFNNKEVNELIKRADKFSFVDNEKDMLSYTEKIKELKDNLIKMDSPDIMVDWESRWNITKSKKEIEREQKFKNLFNPN